MAKKIIELSDPKFVGAIMLGTAVTPTALKFNLEKIDQLKSKLEPAVVRVLADLSQKSSNKHNVAAKAYAEVTVEKVRKETKKEYPELDEKKACRVAINADGTIEIEPEMGIAAYNNMVKE